MILREPLASLHSEICFSAAGQFVSLRYRTDRRHSTAARTDSPSHVPAPPRCLTRAASRHFIKVGPGKGLGRKQMAPAFSARARTFSSGKAVMKINGASEPWVRIAASRSNPLITGICTSAITHDVSFKWADRKNSSADANVWTVYPCELRRLLVAARTDASSSMMEITEGVGNAVLPDAGTMD
jgi:hypothetical protein